MYVLPIAMIALSRYNIKWVALASLFALVGLFYVRWNFIIGGQLTPYLGFTSGGSGAKLATYSPNFTEIAGAVGMIGVMWTAYFLGLKFLPLAKDEQEGLHMEEAEIKDTDTVGEAEQILRTE